LYITKTEIEKKAKHDTKREPRGTFARGITWNLRPLAGKDEKATNLGHVKGKEVEVSSLLIVIILVLVGWRWARGGVRVRFRGLGFLGGFVINFILRGSGVWTMMGVSVLVLRSGLGLGLGLRLWGWRTTAECPGDREPANVQIIEELEE
jgi:hypothetical protein